MTFLSSGAGVDAGNIWNVLTQLHHFAVFHLSLLSTTIDLFFCTFPCFDMADALCGPTNALQTFQKHTQVDRTLQQDRLTGPRHSPAQGFRSFDPRIGSLDAEFHAFENAPTNPFQLEQQAWRPDAGPSHLSQPTSSWASDFQNLHISNTPISVQQFRTEAPLVKSGLGAWQQEFMQQRQSMSPIAQQKHPETISQSSNQPYMPFAGSSSYMHNGMHDQHISSHIQSLEPKALEADFERAFQDAFDHMQTMDTQATTTAGDVVETILNRELHHETALQSEIHEPSHAKIGSDAIEYTEVRDRTPDQDARDASDLARVAGELVQNVSHETNEKFRNSQFLDLMRRIRDREIEVRNNDFESTQQTPSVPQQESTQPRPEEQHSFQFPNMDDVYRPDTSIDMSVDDSVHYHERPQTQISDLHPGGPLYPEQSPPPPRYAQMSGAVDSLLSTDDANRRYASA